MAGNPICLLYPFCLSPLRGNAGTRSLATRLPSPLPACLVACQPSYRLAATKLCASAHLLQTEARRDWRQMLRYCWNAVFWLGAQLLLMLQKAAMLVIWQCYCCCPHGLLPSRAPLPDAALHAAALSLLLHMTGYMHSPASRALKRIYATSLHPSTSPSCPVLPCRLCAVVCCATGVVNC